MPLERHGAKRGPEVHFVEGLLVVDLDATSSAERDQLLSEALERSGGQLTELGQLEEEFGELETVGEIADLVDILAVKDPVAAANALADHERIAASPIHALGFSWHAPYSSIKPEPASGYEFPVLPPGNRDRVVAVVDTGIVEPGSIPGWMSSSVVNGQDDIETLGKDEFSHGTFVASLVRQVAPGHIVSMARSPGYGGDKGRSGKNHPKPPATTEFHITDAILRLLARHRVGCDVEALNLSIGGPSLGRRPMTMIQAALARWRSQFPRCAIFAAAGNSDSPEPIYPAAFRQVRGVAAGIDGHEIVWDSSGGYGAPTAPRNWVDDVAPGSRLVGLGGTGPSDALSWSGSSFASAVAAASYVSGGPVASRHRVSWWPDRDLRYGNVPGLRFN